MVLKHWTLLKWKLKKYLKRQRKKKKIRGEIVNDAKNELD
jgi:hypothetical protein